MATIILLRHYLLAIFNQIIILSYLLRPFLASRIFHIGNKNIYSTRENILDEIIFYKEFYLNCELDLYEENIDLEDKVQVLGKVIYHE